jgi:hypothetical protein
MSVMQRSATTSWVRADAQVIWRARRAADERVSASDRVVIITRGGLSPKSSTTRVVVTDPATVERLRRAFNALPVGWIGTHGCTLDPPQYTVEFAASEHGKPDIVAKAFCGDTSVTVNGKPAATLEGFERTLEPLFDKER